MLLLHKSGASLELTIDRRPPNVVRKSRKSLEECVQVDMVPISSAESVNATDQILRHVPDVVWKYAPVQGA